MKILKYFLISILFLLTSTGKSQTKVVADEIFSGGDILTMEGNSPQYAEALAIKGGKILFAGSKAEADKLKGNTTRITNLQGKTLLPGFFDAHSHIFSVATNLEQGNLYPAPAGKISNIEDIIAEMKSLKVRLKASDTSWLVGKGYDENLLREKRHPTAVDFSEQAYPVRRYFGPC